MARFGVKEVADVVFYNLLTGKAELFLDTLKLSNLENASETVSANGGSGAPKLVTWDFGRTATFNIQDALLNPKALAMQAGTELEKKIETIYERMVAVTVDATLNSKITLPNIPDADSVEIYESEDGYGHDKEVLKSAIVISGKDLEIPTATLAVGKKVIVYYSYQSTAEAEVITLKSDKFGGFYRVVGKTLWRSEETGKDEKVQIVLPKVKISSAFTLTMQPDGDPSVFDMSLECMKPTDSTDMVKLIRY